VQSSDLAVHLVQEAIDSGITFFDNAWEYNGHRSEEWMGLGLRGRRDKVFLMSKVCTHGRDKHFALQQLEESLRRLGTDHLDLWQIHEVIYENDPDSLNLRKHLLLEATIGRVKAIERHLDGVEWIVVRQHFEMDRGGREQHVIRRRNNSRSEPVINA
jgi:aryl-alcohol dehydrogenase-like predicted oxidoreductase